MRYITALGLKTSILPSSVEHCSLRSDLILSQKAKQFVYMLQCYLSAMAIITPQVCCIELFYSQHDAARLLSQQHYLGRQTWKAVSFAMMANCCTVMANKSILEAGKLSPNEQ